MKERRDLELRVQAGRVDEVGRARPLGVADAHAREAQPERPLPRDANVLDLHLAMDPAAHLRLEPALAPFGLHE